jgi:AAA domain
MRPIYTLEDLGAAATDAAALVRAGEVSRAQAADDLQDMAVATGLLERYGADAVQHFISDALRAPNGAPVIASDSEQLARKTEDELCARTLGRSSTTPRVSAINLDRFLKMDIPPRATMLTPWLPVQGLAMIYAPRGTGKTRVAHGVCHAIATGSGFLRWTAPKASRVLLLDGEMPAAVLQEMLQSTVQASKCAMPDPTGRVIGPPRPSRNVDGYGISCGPLASRRRAHDEEVRKVDGPHQQWRSPTACSG